MATLNVTDQDFEEKILKSEKPVLVDFWAEWCVAPDTRVLTASRNTVFAGEVSPSSKLISFTSRGPRAARVSYSKVVEDGGHCMSIKTDSGREIKVTDDHLLLTSEGWKRAIELKKGDRVAAYPHPIEFSTQPRLERVIANEQDIKKKATPSMRVEAYIKQLRKLELLPLRQSPPQLIILARILGALFTDGSLYIGEKNNYREVSFTLGSRADVKQLREDLSSLGFPKLHVVRRSTKNRIAGREFTARTFKAKNLSSALWLLMVSLGAPVGSKTAKAYRLPKWLFESSPAVKQAFLAGFLGGDGPKPTIQVSKRKNKGSYNSIGVNDIEFHKTEKLLKNGKAFAQDIKLLLSEFGVEVKKIFWEEEESYRRKDGQKTVIIHIKIGNNVNSVYSLCNIGYAYSFQKQTMAAIVGEFLGRIRNRRKLWQDLFSKANLLKSKGETVKNISSTLGISYDTVWGWLSAGKKPTSPHHFGKFDKWLKEATRGLAKSFVWDRVGMVLPTFLPAVAKITVDKTHNFVANGFVVHNCGPCKMAEPVLEKLSEEYKDEVAIVKLNVDENPRMTERYGVMSIPTTILFKNGQEVGRQVGFAGKKPFEQLINKV